MSVAEVEIAVSAAEVEIAVSVAEVEVVVPHCIRGEWK